MADPTIRHICGAARWPALYRARETERKDDLFHETESLQAENPSCRFAKVRAGLPNAEMQRSLLCTLAGEGTNALAITEGLLTYLPTQAVSVLAEEWKRLPAFKWWVLDIASPALLRMLQKNTQQFRANVPPLQFAPQEGPNFFAAHGCNPVEVHSTWKTAAGLKRLSFPVRLLALSASRPWSAVCLIVPQGTELRL